MTVLALESAKALGRSSQPLALLTRFPFPKLPSFPLHLRPGNRSDIRCIPLITSVVLPDTMLPKLTSFTLRVYKDIFNKTYETNDQNMSYWLAPVTRSLPIDLENAQPESLIDWPIIQLVYENEEIPWSIDLPLGRLSDRYLIDRWDGGRRFFSIEVAPELKPSDPVPDGSAAHKYMNSIIDYTVSLFSKSRARATWRIDQPVILAHRILHRRNWLDDWSEAEETVKTLSYICPEPLKFSAVSV